MRKIFAVAALFISSCIYAQDSIVNVTIADRHPLDAVTITANKFPQKQSQTGKVLTVIDRRTLNEMSGRTVSEIINTVAGTVVNGANNNLGTNQRLSIRGSSDGNVLVLIDGIPVNDPSVITNYYDLNFLAPSQIERIEVLKGGQSTLYGSDAVAGVINIITRKGDRKFAPYASANYGSYNTSNGNAGVRGYNKGIGYNVSASFVNSAGFSSAYDSSGNGNFDKDGFRQSVVRGDLSVKLSNQVQWNIFGNYSTYDADIDAAAFRDDKDFTTRNRNFQAGTGFSWQHGKGNLKFNYHFNYVDRFYFDDSIDRASFAYYSVSNYIGRTHFAEVYETFKWNRVSLLLGIDHRYFNSDQEYRSASMFGPYNTKLGDTADMKQTSPYASLIYNHDGLNIELGGRLNHHSVYGDNFSYTFNPSYFIHRIKLFANLYSAFKTPTLYQLFDPMIGNTVLSPERSTIVEGGLQFIGDDITARATGFYRRTKNAIQYITTDPVFFTGQYRNLNRLRNYGAEFELGYRNASWNLNANYSYTRGNVKSGYSESGDELAKDTSYNNLYRVPEHAFNIFGTYQINTSFSLSTLLKYVGSRLEPVYASAPRKLDSYVTIDLTARWQMNQQFRAFVDLKNLTNKRYFDVLGYNSRRFNFNVGVDVQL